MATVAMAAAVAATPLGSQSSSQEQGILRKRSAIFSSVLHHPSSSLPAPCRIYSHNGRKPNQNLSSSAAAVDDVAATAAAATAAQLVTNPRILVVSMAAPKKGNKKGGGESKQSKNGGGGAPAGAAKESASANETRRIILSVQKLKKMTPTAKHSFFAKKDLYLSGTAYRVRKRASGIVACAGGASIDDGDDAAPEVDVSVMSFTLGIPGFDDSELPRLLGILFGSCIVLNHLLTRAPISDAQLRSEMMGMFLSAVTIALPNIGRHLKGRESTNSSKMGVRQSSIIAFAESLTDGQKKELAWGSYALLRNTKTSAMLVWEDGDVVCARGSWDVTGHGAMALASLGSKLRNTPALQMSDAVYIPKGADAKVWEVVPKGATCLFIQPVVEPDKNNQTIASTGLIVISNCPHAFSSKDRLWFLLFAKKFSQSLTI